LSTAARKLFSVRPASRAVSFSYFSVYR